MTSPHTSESPVGFIGLGIMGHGMAANLVRSGKRLVVWNRTASKAEAFAREHNDDGAPPSSSPPPPPVQLAQSAREVVERCRVTYSMLTTPEVVRQVHFDPHHGTLQGMAAGKVLVECSTLDAGAMREIHAHVTARGGRFLEAPVSGSKAPAESGSLIFLCSGDAAAFKELCDGDLAAMGKRSFFFGEQIGGGTHMKLVVNMIMGNMMVALAEGANLAEACGLSSDSLHQVLQLGAMSCPLFSTKLPKMAQQDYEPNFPLKHQQKDMRLALNLGDEKAVALPTAAVANEVYKRARGMGFADEDCCAVYESAKDRSRPKEAPESMAAAREHASKNSRG